MLMNEATTAMIRIGTGLILGSVAAFLVIALSIVA